MRARWFVDDKRVERICRDEGLRVPVKERKRNWPRLADGSCAPPRAEHPKNALSYAFVEDRAHHGRKYRMLNMVNGLTHERSPIRLDRKR